MAYASDKKPLELTALTTLATDDTFIVGDTSDTSEVAKSITKANLEADLTPALADTVTTNANLTGHVTSTGNATVLGSFTKAQLDTAVSDGTLQVQPAEGAFVDGDKTKLDGIEALADVTDTANVTAAGALMDSELANIAAVKALDQGVATTDSPTFANVTDSGLTASEIVITNGTKVLTSAAVATYPSLTELTYVKGVTSAIQTQLNAKGVGDALTTNPLSQFASTTSSQLAGVLSDETGSGAAVFATSPTLVTPILGTPTSGTLTNCTGLPVNGIVDDTTSALGVGTLELGHATDTTLSRAAAGSLAVEGVAVPTISSTSTLTNKRITKRTGTTTSSTSLTIASDDVDRYTVTALAAAMTINAPSGTPTDGQTLVIRIKDNATGRALTWNAIFRAIGVTLPTTTVASKTMYIGCMYNTADTKWDVTAVAEEA